MRSQGDTADLSENLFVSEGSGTYFKISVLCEQKPNRLNDKQGVQNALCEYPDYQGRCDSRKKRQIVEEVTATLGRVLGKKPEHTPIVIQEIDAENWGFSGMLTTDYRKL